MTNRVILLTAIQLLLLLNLAGCKSKPAEPPSRHVNESSDDDLRPITQPPSPAYTPDKIENTITGNDSDNHGCIPSAGYNWSKALNECVRLWQSAITLPISKDHGRGVVWLIFSPNKQLAEIFEPKEKESVILERSSSSTPNWVGSNFELIENTDATFILKQAGKVFAKSKTSTSKPKPIPRSSPEPSESISKACEDAQLKLKNLFEQGTACSTDADCTRVGPICGITPCSGQAVGPSFDNESYSALRETIAKVCEPSACACAPMPTKCIAQKCQ